jgi:predicted nuclease of restriction endonuclease-like (RecB) superfamily
MTDLDHHRTALYDRVAAIIESARTHIARSVNTAMVHAYWYIGREIVEVEQEGRDRAGYGERVIEELASRLTDAYGDGFGARTLRRMRHFYLTFPKGSALPGGAPAEKRTTASSISGGNAMWTTALSESREASATLFPPLLSWSHYLVLLKVKDDSARSFYEIEAARESWSVRQLERQIASLLFERLSLNKTPEELLVLARTGQEVAIPSDVIKDPFVLEFLDLRDMPSAHERDLEQAIIDRLEAFLLELGKGFCFVGRQKRITLEGDHFYVDLVFYNRLLRCFVLIDLKLGKLTHQDLGQMQMYVNFFDRFQRVEHEDRTVGIVLCSDKNDAMVRITLPEENTQVHAARYQLALPTEEELLAELRRERDEAERVLRLQGDEGP